jgi:hypothetical protein
MPDTGFGIGLADRFGRSVGSHARTDDQIVVEMFHDVSWPGLENLGTRFPPFAQMPVRVRDATFRAARAFSAEPTAR